MKDPAVVFFGVAQTFCLDKAQQIVDHIKYDGLTPIDTGRLIDSYKAQRAGRGAAVVTDVDYWRFVEFGTRYMSAQPHVRPAYEAARLETSGRIP
jgi:HK97 gp10 family phage protein